jgi:hypothetical protein
MMSAPIAVCRTTQKIARNCGGKKHNFFVRYSASLFWQTIFGGLFFHNTHKLHVYCLFVVLKLTSVDKAL